MAPSLPSPIQPFFLSPLVWSPILPSDVRILSGRLDFDLTGVHFSLEKTTYIMVHLVDESDGNSECLSLIAVWYTDDGSAPTGGSMLTYPISKYLVSFDLSHAKKIELIKEMLANKNEQQAAKRLEPGEASRLVEMLDLVHLFLSSSLRHRCLTGSRFGKTMDRTMDRTVG